MMKIKTPILKAKNGITKGSVIENYGGGKLCILFHGKLKGAPEKLEISVKIKAYDDISFKEFDYFNKAFL